MTITQEIAHKELIQKPQYIADCCKNKICALVPRFPNLVSLTEKYEFLVPSTSRIRSCIHADPVTDAEIEPKVPGNSSETVNICKVISGSELMLFEAIQVSFTNLAKLSRRPITHTCNTVLELSSTYQSFPDLKEEFNNILTAENREINNV